MSVRFALVGPGAVAAHHVKALRQLKDAEIVILCHPQEEAARRFGDKFDLPWTTDFDALLQRRDIDVVDVTTPSGAHAEVGIAAARAGKHVVVEKPIDVTLDKADALISACRTAGVRLGVISQYRFMDPVLELHGLLREGKLGELIQGDAYIKWYRSQDYYDSGDWRGTWALDGGGPFINQGIHFIDLLLSVMGPVKWVHARTRTVNHRIEVEDIGTAMVEFVSGAQGVIQASTAIYPGLPARLEVHGSRGTVIVEGEKLALKAIEGEQEQRQGDVVAAGAASPMSIDVKPFVRQFQDYLEALSQDRDPAVSGEVARCSLQLILAIYESNRRGKPVTLQGD